MTMYNALVLVVSIFILNANLVDGDEKFRSVCRSEVNPLISVYSNTRHDMLTCARMCLESEACNYFATRRQTSGHIVDCVLGFAKQPCGWNTSQSASAKWTTHTKSGPLQVCNCSVDMIPFGNNCYIFPYGTFTWDDGNAHCANLSAKMVEVEDMTENGFLALEGKTRGYDEIWLGGTDSVTEGTWVWNSGAAIPSNNWNPGEPNNQGNEDRLELLMSSSEWNDIPETSLNYLVCQLSCL